MGCLNASQVTNFARANTKEDLKVCYNTEINRLKILKDNLSFDLSKPEDKSKVEVLNKILHEDNWLILPILENAGEEHISKLKFLFVDYFNVTETWVIEDLKENMNKIIDYYNENKDTIQIIPTTDINDSKYSMY